MSCTVQPLDSHPPETCSYPKVQVADTKSPVNDTHLPASGRTGHCNIPQNRREVPPSPAMGMPLVEIPTLPPPLGAVKSDRDLAAIGGARTTVPLSPDYLTLQQHLQPTLAYVGAYPAVHTGICHPSRVIPGEHLSRPVIHQSFPSMPSPAVHTHFPAVYDRAPRKPSKSHGALGAAPEPAARQHLNSSSFLHHSNLSAAKFNTPAMPPGRRGHVNSPSAVIDMKSLTAALVKAREGAGEVEAILCQARFCPRLPGLTKLIGVLSKQHQSWRKALEVYQTVPMLGLVPDTALTNSAISACDRGGQWETALKLWMEMSHRDNISYSAMISALAKGRQWSLALEVFCFMMKAGCCPDVITCCSLISALDKGNYWQLAERVFLDLWMERLGDIEMLLQTSLAGGEIPPCSFQQMQDMWGSNLHGQNPSHHGPHGAPHLSLWSWCCDATDDGRSSFGFPGACSDPTFPALHCAPDDMAPLPYFHAQYVDDGLQPLLSEVEAHGSSGGCSISFSQMASGCSAVNDGAYIPQPLHEKNMWSPTHAESLYLHGQKKGAPAIFDSQAGNHSGLREAGNVVGHFGIGHLQGHQRCHSGIPAVLPPSFSSLCHDDVTALPATAPMQSNVTQQNLLPMMSSLKLKDTKAEGNIKAGSRPRPSKSTSHPWNFKFVNTICCNALLSAYANASPPQWKRALLLLSAMQSYRGKIVADCVAYNTVMKACRSANQLDEAYKVFGYMMAVEVAPSVATFSTMICAALNHQHHEMVLHLWGCMLDSGIAPSAACANAAVNSLEHMGKWEEARSIFNSLAADPRFKSAYETQAGYPSSHGKQSVSHISEGGCPSGHPVS